MPKALRNCASGSSGIRPSVPLPVTPIRSQVEFASGEPNLRDGDVKGGATKGPAAYLKGLEQAGVGVYGGARKASRYFLHLP